MTGLCGLLGGTTVLYQSKRQKMVTTSSTEAEFISAVHNCKYTKYIRSILHDLQIQQKDPNTTLVDKEATIHMANSDKPTNRTRHMEITYFVIQEWVRTGILRLKHLQGTSNTSDALTKALGWVLLNRHVTLMMGLQGSPYTDTYGKMKTFHGT